MRDRGNGALPVVSPSFHSFCQQLRSQPDTADVRGGCAKLATAVEMGEGRTMREMMGEMR